MNADWWFQVFGQEMGPVGISELRAYIRDGTVGPADLVRRGERGQWMKVSALGEVLEPGSESSSPGRDSDSGRSGTAPPSRTVRSAHTVSPTGAGTPTPRSEQEATVSKSDASSCEEARGNETLQHRSQLSTAIRDANRDALRKSRSRTGQSTSGDGTRGVVSGSIGGGIRSLGRRLASTLTILSHVVTPLEWVFNVVRQHVLVCSILLVMAAGITAVIFVPQYWWTDAGIYRELRAFQQQLEDLRGQGTGPNEWSRFADRSADRAQQIVAQIEGSVDSRQPVRLELLWACRDALPAMLVRSQHEVNAAEHRFVDHLDRAGRLLETPATPQDSEQLILIGTIINVLVLASVVMWMWRRK